MDGQRSIEQELIPNGTRRFITNASLLGPIVRIARETEKGAQAARPLFIGLNSA